MKGKAKVKEGRKRGYGEEKEREIEKRENKGK